MKIYTKLVVSIESGAVIKRESYEYSGTLAECMSGGGSKQKSNQKSQQTSESESGTKWNEDFMSKALEFAKSIAPDRVKNNLNNTQDLLGMTSDSSDSSGIPNYNPAYVKGQYTGANFTPVAQDGFQKLEDSLYGGQKSKLAQAYNESVARQREELAQMGALNSTSQFLEGSARSSLDKGYIASLQQAARDAFQGRLGVEVSEAGRRTAFDASEAGRRTAYDTGEAGRETAFNEQTAVRLFESWLKKLGIAIEAGRYSKGQGQGTSSGQSSGMSGQGSIFWG